MILLSVITPHYNMPEKLRRLSMSIPQLDWVEHIVVDDKSDKDPILLEAAKAYVTERGALWIDNRTEYKGTGICRDLGIGQARGRWILIADADDFFLEGAFETINKYLSHTEDIIFFAPTSVMEGTGKPSSRHKPYERLVREYLTGKTEDTENRLRYLFVMDTSKMIRTDLIRRGNIRSDKTLVANDVMFSVQCSYLAKSILAVRKPIYCLTESEGTLTTVKDPQRFQNRINVFAKECRFLRLRMSADEYYGMRLSSRSLLFHGLLDYGVKEFLRAIVSLWKNGAPVNFLERKEGILVRGKEKAARQIAPLKNAGIGKIFTHISKMLSRKVRVPKTIRGYEALETAGTKNVCIVAYDVLTKDKDLRLARFLRKHGFKVSYADGMNGLMKRYFRLKLSERLPSAIHLAWKIGYWKVLFSRTFLQKKPDTNQTVFILTANGWGREDDWLHEEAQILLGKLGAKKRIFYYQDRDCSITKIGKPILGHIDYHVAWHCNLKCKGCSHYSNLMDRQLFGNLERFSENLLRLHSLFENIEIIWLLGGEPFLNRSLGEFVLVAHEIFPKTRIHIVTNGLLIPTIPDQLMELLCREDVVINITNYPPTAEKKEAIVAKLEKHGVEYDISPEVKAFQYEVCGNESDGAENYNHCLVKTCHFLNDDGRLGVCNAPILYDENRNRLKTVRNVSEEDWVRLEKETDGYAILEKLHRPIPFCRYCMMKKRIMFPWEGHYTKELTEDDF